VAVAEQQSEHRHRRLTEGVVAVERPPLEERELAVRVETEVLVRRTTQHTTTVVVVVV